MKYQALLKTLIFASLLIMHVGAAVGDEIRVAVASNFSEVIRVIAERFTIATGHQVVVTSGSTGKQYAQIHNGAPYDVFFAADVERPRLLEEEGLAIPGERFTYALGRVVLWSPQPGYVDPDARVLEQGEFRHLAIANPKLAPYGRAAREVLQTRGAWSALQGRIVRGENIGQAFQYVRSGNAELGFVASSQVNRPGRPAEGSAWEVPRSLYTPIEQQAVLLKDSSVARMFLAFVKNEESRGVIREFGYGLP